MNIQIQNLSRGRSAGLSAFLAVSMTMGSAWAAIEPSIGPLEDFPTLEESGAFTTGTRNGERTVNGTRIMAQTFQIAEGFDVGAISIQYARGVTNASATVQMFPVLNVNAASIQADYDAAVLGGLLLNGSFAMPETLNDNTLRTLTLTLTGEHQITLAPTVGTAGYAILFTPTETGVEVFTWQLSTVNPYAGGRAFHDTLAAAQTGRDFVLALTPVPEPSTIALAVLGGLALLVRGRRRASA